RHHHRSGEMICRSERPIHAAVGFEALELHVAFEGGKPEDARLTVFVLHGLEKADLARDDRSARGEAWRPRFDAPEFASPAPGARLEIVDGDLPAVSGPLCLDCRYGSSRKAELGREGSTAHLDRADGINRQLDRIFPRHRIRPVRAVEHEGTLIAARTADVEQPVRSSYDARNQRQRVLKTLARYRRRLHDAGGESLDVSGDWAPVDGLRAGCHIDFLVKRLEIEPQCDIGWLVRPRHDRFDCRLETREFSDYRAGTGRHISKPKLPLLVRH